MRLSSRVKQFSVSAAVLALTGCASSLPDLPLELPPRANQQDSAPTTATPATPPVLDGSSAPTASLPDIGPSREVQFEVESTVTGTTNPVLPEAELPESVVSNPGQPDQGGIEVLHKASYNPFNRDNGKSFRALNTFEIYRSELGRHSIETPKPVDFRSNQVLVSSIGEKPTGGYNVSATDIQEYDNNVVVTVIQTIPGPGCITTQSATHPFEFIVVPSLKPIEIFERQRIDEC